jgi:hypothetical protein
VGWNEALWLTRGWVPHNVRTSGKNLQAMGEEPQAGRSSHLAIRQQLQALATPYSIRIPEGINPE